MRPLILYSILTLQSRKNRQTCRHPRALFTRKGSTSRPCLEVLEDRLSPATLNWVNASGGDWDTASNWDLNRVPVAGDNAVINQTGITITHSTSASDVIDSLTSNAALSLSGGTLSIAADSAIASDLILSGGTLTGNGNLTVSGLLNWTGGTMSGSGQTIAQGGLTIDGDWQYRYLDNRTLTNAGAAIWTATGNHDCGLRVQNGAVINNLPGATWNFQSDATPITQDSGIAGTFRNEGTLLKSAGTSIIFIGIVFNNTGSVFIQSGTLSLEAGGASSGSFQVQAGATLAFEGGTHTFNSGASLSVAGSLVVSEGTVNFTPGSNVTSLAALALSGGTVNFSTGSVVNPGVMTESDGNLAGSDTIIISGLLTWTDGRMSGPGTTTAQKGIALGSDWSWETLDGRTLNNYGTAVWVGFENYLWLQHDAVWNNEPGSSLDSQDDSQRLIGGATSVFNNQGTLKKSAGGDTTTIEVSLNNTGSVQVTSGTLELESVTVNGNGTLVSQPTATLNIAGDMLGQTQQANKYLLQGTTLLNGYGDSSSPQLLEVMSRDLGNSAAGFTNNFDYGTLALDDYTYVRLVDYARNSAGTGPEAVYVNGLIVPSGSTLDLNGLHLYARGSQIRGEVLNGTISYPPSGGALVLATPTSGSLNSSSQVDNWTFFGRAGQTITTAVGTGMASYPPPMSPAVAYAQVTLLDPNSNILGTASNTQGGANATLAGVVLPTDGTYQVRVQVPAGHSGSTGFYSLVVADATIHTAPLTINDTTTGQLSNSYSADHWTFAATAGEQVQFLFIAAASSDIHFDLTGPNGYTAFSDATGSSNPINLPSDGTYTVTVHTVRQPGGYAFQLQQISVTPLAVGTPYHGALIASGQAQLFTFTATGSYPTIIDLSDANHQDHNEVYVKLGSAPTRDSYDYRFSSPGAAQRIRFTSIPGTYYVLVYNDLVASTGVFALTVQNAPFIATGLTPGRIGNAHDSTLLVSGIFPVGRSAGGGLPLTLTHVVLGANNIWLWASFTFSATVGQPVQLEFDQGVSCSLKDPHGQTIYSGVTSPSGWIPLSDSGIYTVFEYNRSLYGGFYGLHVLAQAVPILATGPTIKFIADDGTSYPSQPLPLSLISDPTYLQNRDLTGLGNLEGTVITGVTIPANTLPAGTYSVNITDNEGNSQTLSNALTVVQGGIGELKTDVIVPSVIGNHANATIYVQYSNVGDAPLAAPLLVLSASRPSTQGAGLVQGAFLTLDPNLRESGAWTSGIPDRFSTSVQFLGSGAIPGVLQPGESIRVPVYYAGWRSDQWNFSDPSIYFNLGALTDDNTQAIDWSLLKSSLKPATMTPTAWDALYPNLASQLGATWGDYVTKLSIDAQYLHGLGETVTDIGQLYAFEVQQAAGYSPLATLASATDAQVDAPGLSLSLGRTFQPSLISRNQFGRFGWGWADSWDTSITVDSDGSVNVHGPGGSLRRFQPDLRGGYFAQPGDHGTLVSLPGGGCTLTELNGQVTAYNADGTLNTIQDSNSNRITAGYTSGLLTSLTHSSGQSLTLTYNAAGLVTSITDSAGRTTTYTYDPTNQYLLSVVLFDGRTTSYAYDTGSNPTTAHALLSVTYPDGSHDFFTYDFPQGRLTEAHRDAGANDSTFSYAEGQVTVADALHNQTIYSFDNRGLLVAVQNPLGHGVQFTYDANLNLAQMVDAGGQVYSNTYDTRGNLLTSTDPLGHTVRYTYTATNNQLASVTDGNGNGNTTRYSYDGKGNLTSTTYADGTVESVAHDPIGNVLSITNRRGQPIGYTYDAAGNVLTKTYPDGSQVVYAYDTHENLTSATDSSGTTTLTFDANDRLTQITYPSGRYLNFSYDMAGRQTKMVDQDGFTVNYGYDPLGRLESLTDGADKLIVRYSYDAVGRLSREDKGNGTYTTYEYDAASDLLHLINSAPDGTVNSRFDYTYDAFSLRVTEARLDGTWTYSYDTIGQLVHAVFASTNPAIPDQDMAYAYDAAGNRTQTIINGVTTVYTTNNLNEYTQVGGTTYGYDADGNLITKTDPGGTTTYTYNTENQLTAVTGPSGSWTYAYDAFGSRAATTANGQTTQYLISPFGMGNLVSIYGSTGALLDHYTYGLRLVSQVDAWGAAVYFDTDAVHSVVGLSSSSGTYLNTYWYSPFGSVLSATQNADTPFQFNGAVGVMAEGNGLDFMRTRYYDPEVGRFSQPDPIGFGGGQINLYNFVANNPVMSSDPTGRQIPPPNALAGAIAAYQAIEPLVIQASNWAQILLQGFVNKGGWPALKSASEWMTQPAPEWLYNIITGPIHLPHEILKWFRELKTKSVQAQDPNALYGPAGFGPSGFVAADTLFPYRIDFENDPAATAPAQRVDITDQLDPNLDWNTFQLTGFGFGDTTVNIPAGSQHYQTTVPVTSNGQTFEVLARFDFNAQTGMFHAAFQSIDPNTNLPPDVLTGFLSPEDGTGRGMGYITYLILPKTGLATGTQIRNVAQVQFDRGEIIATDQVAPHDPSQGVDPAKQALNTIDAGAATSSVNALPAQSPPSFLVTWTGQDDAGGAGIDSYIIYVSEDGGAFQLWQSAIAATSAVFTGQVGHSYGFYSVATDNVGHVEVSLPIAQASTQVIVFPPTSSVRSLPSYSPASFTVSWSGQDYSGTGIASFDVYVSEDGAGFQQWLTATTLTSALFNGQAGHDYGFYSVATDNVGNVQTIPAGAQATTTTVPAPVVITHPASCTAFAGTTVTFTAAATGVLNPTVQWQVSTDGGHSFTDIGGATSTSCSFTAASNQTGNQYRAVFTNAGGSAATNPATLTINPALAILANPTSQLVRIGQKVTFTANGTGTPKPTMQWQVSRDSGLTFSNITGATAATLTLTVTAGLNSNLYRAVFRNSGGQAATATAGLTVDFTLHVGTQAQAVTVSPGTPVTCIAAAKGSPQATVQWQVSSDRGKTYTLIPGATSTAWTFLPDTYDSGKLYQAIFTNANGTAKTAAVTLTVTVPPAVATGPASQTVATGKTATFTATASGIPAPTVQWQVSTDGGLTFSDIGGATSTKLALGGVTATRDGNKYRVLFTNAAGQVETSAATLTVTSAPFITLQPKAQTVVLGNLVTLTAAAMGSPQATVQWQASTDKGKTFIVIPGATSAVWTFTPQAADSGKLYQAVFTNANGTARTAAIALTVNVPPAVVTSPGDQSASAGQTVTFTATASGSPAPTVKWQVSLDGGTTWTAINGATTAKLTLSRVTGAQDGNQYRALFTNAAGQMATGAASLTVTSVPVITLQPAAQAVVCGNPVTFSATAKGSPQATVQWQVSTDKGKTFTVIPGATSAVWTFTPQAADSGKLYQAVFTNTNGTARTAAIALTVNVPPAVVTSPVDQSVSAGQTVTFTATASGSPAPTVKWQVSLDGGTTWTAINGATTAKLTLSRVTGAQDGNQYRTLFTNVAGQIATGSAALTVTSAPFITLQPTAQTVVLGNPVTFTAAAKGSPQATVQWQVSTDKGKTFNPIPGATSASWTFTPQATDSGKLYQAVFTNANGQTRTIAAALTVNVPPTLLTSPGNQTVRAGNTVTFMATASGSPTPTIQWQVSTNGGSTWTAIRGATTTKLTLSQVNATLDGNQYRAVFTNVAGQDFSGVATLTVNSAPVIVS